jgi:hypothetical protein
LDAGDEQGGIDAIAWILPIPLRPFPLGFEEETEWEVRRLHASAWVNVKLTDPDVVRPWVEAGVHNAGVARKAIRLGYRPEDPWVEKSPPSLVIFDGRPVKVPGHFAAWRNRRKARRAWAASEAKRVAVEVTAREKADQVVAVMRETTFDEGFGLAALDLLHGTGGTIQSGDVIRGFDELVTQVHGMRSQVDRDGYLSDENAEMVSYSLLMAHVLENTLHVCTAEEQTTITPQLADAKSWLNSMTT